MKRIVIYYFSGTGNTWWVANNLYLQLIEKKHNVECYSIETLSKDEIIKQVNEAEHIVIGFPVYGSTAPKPMLEFLAGIPKALNNQTASVFGTHALGSGDSAYHIGLLLDHKGFRVVQTRHFRMMNNFHIPSYRFYKPKNNKTLFKLLEKTKPKVKEFADEIDKEVKHIIGNNRVGHFFGKFQRKHINQVIRTVSREFRIDITRCIDCGKCQRICPTKNIKKHEGIYIFDNHCALCLRCYSQCPTSAILLGEGTKNIEKYPRYKGPKNNFNIYNLIDK